MKKLLCGVVVLFSVCAARAELVAVTLPDGKLVWVYVARAAPAPDPAKLLEKSQIRKSFEESSKRSNEAADRWIEEYLKKK